MKRLLTIAALFACIINLQAQWNNDPQVNTQLTSSSGADIIPKTDVTNTGASYVSYLSNASGNYDVFLQKLDSKGYFEWAEPFLVSDHQQQSWVSDYAMKTDGAGNAIITFSDIRNGNPDIFLYKVSPEGSHQWGENGITCYTSSMPEYEPRLAVTSENAAIVTFIHPTTAGSDELVIYGANESGEPMFGEQGMTYIPEGDTFFADPYVVPAQDGNFIVVYSKNTGSSMYPNRHLRAMKFNNSGNELWSEVVVSNAGGISQSTDLNVIPDGNGGVVISWNDDRDNDMQSSAFTQWVNSEGIAQYPQNGLELITTAATNCYDPRAVVNPDGRVMVFWTQKNSNKSLAGLYGQLVSSEGERLWTDNGAEFYGLDSKFDFLWVAKSFEEPGAVVFYTLFDGASDQSLLAAAINPQGGFFWEEEDVLVSSANSGITNPVATPLSNGQYIASWTDNRNDNNDIYAQNLTTDGTLGLTNTSTRAHESIIFNVYPNPTSSVINIDHKNALRVTIRDLTGQLVADFKRPQPRNLAFRPKQSGLYFVTLYGNKEAITKKVTVLRK